MAFYILDASSSVEGYTVTLKVTYYRDVLFLINGQTDPIDERDPRVRLRLALAARRLWESALKTLPPGVYTCTPTDAARWRLYVSAGWRPCDGWPEDLVYYHQVSPAEGNE